MRNKLILIGFALVLGLGCAGLVMGATHQALAMPANQDWREVNELTIGDIYNIDGTNPQVITETHKVYLPCVSKACLPTYFEDFSNPASGWPVYDNYITHYEYVNGEYQVLIKVPWEGHGVITDAYADDFRVEVDARPASHLDGGLALIFSWIGTNQSYIFEISDGWYTLWKSTPTGLISLIEKTYSSDINPGYTSNRLGVVRNGSSIALYANNHLLNTTSDSTYFGTWVGLMSISYGTAYFDGRFDNYAIYTGCLGPQQVAQPDHQAISFTEFWMERGMGSARP